MVNIELGGLSCRFTGGNDGNGGGDGPLVVLLHGYGAPGTDLVDLGAAIPCPDGTRFLFPQAPIDLARELGAPGDARAWWLLDMMAAQVAVLTQNLEALAESLRPGIDEALGHLARLMSAVSQGLEADPQRIVLGGFSQGAILSLEAVLSETVDCGALLLFSPSIVSPATLPSRVAAVRKRPIAVSHGSKDPILPFILTQTLEACLRSAGWQVDWAPFLGGHGIGPEAIASASRLLFNHAERCAAATRGVGAP